MQSPWVGIDTVSDHSWPCTNHYYNTQVGSQVRVGDAVQGRQGQGRAPAQGHREGRVRRNPLLPAGGAGEEGLIHLCLCNTTSNIFHF